MKYCLTQGPYRRCKSVLILVHPIINNTQLREEYYVAQKQILIAQCD